MRILVFVSLMTACLTGSGCAGRLSAPSSFQHLAARNLTQEPVRWFDDCVVFKHTIHKHAKAAWAEVARNAPPQLYTKDYEQGFIEGYVDYLDSGGVGEPPTAAIYRYRLSCYKNPRGVQAAQDWFTGFRHGAGVALQSGLREQILVPLSSPILMPSAANRPSSTTPQTANTELPPPNEAPPKISSEAPLPLDNPIEELLPPPAQPLREDSTNHSLPSADEAARTRTKQPSAAKPTTEGGTR